VAEAALRAGGRAGVRRNSFRSGAFPPVFGGGTVANPLGKKNPFMSMWLSAANAWAGAARGLMAAEARRQAKAATNAATRAPARKKRRKSK
jgi:hypothetical protein